MTRFTPRAQRTSAPPQNVREMDTLQQMQHVVAGMIGQRLMYKDLTA